MSQPTATSGVADPTASTKVRQYTRTGTLGVWAAAAVPMGLFAWVAAPALAGSNPSPRDFALALIWALTAGLVWQFVLVVALLAWELRRKGRSALRWSAVRAALWLQPPMGRDGRRGGRLWWWALAVAVAVVAAVGAVQQIPYGWDVPADRDLGSFLSTVDGQSLFQGNWTLFALVVVMLLFNTVLGEELLFRGLLLPRMHRAFGKGDWVANGVLFGLYHLHQPWSMPGSVASGLVLAYGTRRWRSAWLGIIAHSGQSVFFTAVILAIVVS